MAYVYNKIGEQVYSEPDKAARAIRKAAKKFTGKVEEIATYFGVNRTTLYRWISTLDSDYGHDVRTFIDKQRETSQEKERKAKLKKLNDEVRGLLLQNGGHIKAAAESAEVSENTVYTWLRQLEAGGFKIRAYAKKLRNKRPEWQMYEPA